MSPFGPGRGFPGFFSFGGEKEIPTIRLPPVVVLSPSIIHTQCIYMQEDHLTPSISSSAASPPPSPLHQGFWRRGMSMVLFSSPSSLDIALFLVGFIYDRLPHHPPERCSGFPIFRSFTMSPRKGLWSLTSPCLCPPVPPPPLVSQKQVVLNFLLSPPPYSNPLFPL